MSGATILIADDHPLFRDALKLAALRAAPDALILEASSLSEAIRVLRGPPGPDLVLLDLKMSDCEGFTALAQLHAERPSTPILVVSGADAQKGAQGARELGAVGFVPKSAALDEMASKVAAALAGASTWTEFHEGDPEVEDAARRIASLTPTQLKVLLGILGGRLNKQIAYEMNISEATVKAHVSAVMRKLDVSNRTQAALAARALALDVEAIL